MSRSASLIVDVQNDFCSGGALAVPNGEEVVKPLNQIIYYGRENDWLILVSRDWHPANTTHFKDFGGIWPSHCVQNTSGAGFHSGLEIESVIVISKGTRDNENAYSAFDGFDNNKPLAEVLRHNHVDTLYIGGLATDYCVKATALDAVKQGFKTYLLLNACRPVNLQKDDGEKAVQEMAAAGVVITTTQEVIND